MKVLIITTLPNAVTDSLLLNQQVDLYVVDCAEDYNTIDKRVKKFIDKQKPDMILAYRCPYILPEHIYSVTPLGAYNIHPSLLPKYPGLNPWTKIFANKEKISGVTLHSISNLIDKGNILFQKEFRIEFWDTLDIARQNADKIAAELATSLINSIQIQRKTLIKGPT